MTQLISTNAKYAEWLTTHNFENCKLNRKDYGEFLADYITGERDGFVLNLNGSWGTGKTEFLKRLYSDLLQRNHPVIYVDAWESDFSNNPLTVVTSELLTQLEKFNGGIGSEKTTKQVKHFFAKALKGSLVGIAGLTTKTLIGDSAIGTEAINQLLDTNSETFTTQLTEEYAEQVGAIQKIRQLLGQLAEVLEQTYAAELPVVVLVDELDRCRPTYAIEMLEVIKHFFTTQNFVFVIASDTEQLGHSITAVYGNKFDSQQYLKRFFDRKACLPEADIEHYIAANNTDYSTYSKLNLFPSFLQKGRCSNHTAFINKTVSLLANGYGLKIRDVDQLMNKLHSCLRSTLATQTRQEKCQIIHLPALIIGLIEQDKRLEGFDRRNDKTIIISPLQNSSLNVASRFTLEKLVEMSMNSVVKQNRTCKNEWGEEIKACKLPSYQYFKSHDNERASYELNCFIANSNDTIDEYSRNSSEQRYLLWSDLKKLIELSGNIE